MEKENPVETKSIAKRRGGRPLKKACLARKYKHTLFLSEPEEKVLRQMQEKTGKHPADLFRHGLFGKGLRIPKARIVPAELMDLLTDFKRKSGLIQLLAHRERDFTSREKDTIIGSSNSIRRAIERLERSVFESLEKADELEQLRQLLISIEQVKDDVKLKDKMVANDFKKIEQLLENTKQLLKQHYHYLTLS